MHVRENRLTGLAIHLLIGLSLLLLPLLKDDSHGCLVRLVPVHGCGFDVWQPVLSNALSLWLKDPTLYPGTHYIRRVPRWTMHTFTALQVTCLGVLWIVKSSTLGILFPVFIALLVPVRLLAGRLFTTEHLAALDGEEEPSEAETHWSA